MSEELGAEWNRAMLAGDFERAWRTSDRIRAEQTPDPHRFWQGEPLAGRRVMLRCLHGFGDSIQFLRYVPLLYENVASVCVEVAPAFARLATYINGVREVVSWGQDAPPVAPKWDVQVEATELPYIFRTQAADLPIAVNYLRVPADEQPQNVHGMRVGLVWTAGNWDSTRSIDLDLLQHLFHVQGCQFWNLQPEAAPLAYRDMLREDEQCRRSLVAMARRIAQLDLVITVDTLAAHVAGAMGKPAWVLLKHTADWRWMEAGDDSPWYPSLRLFRQTIDGDWTSPIAHVTAELTKLAGRQPW